MTPTQTFENYPEFANAGQKSQPNDAKYAAGFIPSDVLPAEWLNWFLNGATKGVTALNAGVRSVEQEINAVLESRSVTPDINIAGQLLAVLNKIKEEAINEAWPVGITYPQYPQQKSPQELFPNTTWEVISYGGAFFRAEGGNANAFIEKTDVLSVQNESAPNITGNLGTQNSNYVNAFQGVYAEGAFVVTQNRESRYFENYGSVTSTSKVSFNANRVNSAYGRRNEVAPANYTFRIWKRTA